MIIGERGYYRLGGNENKHTIQSQPKPSFVLHSYGNFDGFPLNSACSWSTLRRWPWCFKVFLLLSAITSGHLRSVGWGGVGWGMMTFLKLAHMVGATQHHVSCTCTHGRCYATSCFLHLHTWSVLRNIMFLALAHMVGATQHRCFFVRSHHFCYTCSSNKVVFWPLFWTLTNQHWTVGPKSQWN